MAWIKGALLCMEGVIHSHKDCFSTLLGCCSNSARGYDQFSRLLRMSQSLPRYSCIIYGQVMSNVGVVFAHAQLMDWSSLVCSHHTGEDSECMGLNCSFWMSAENVQNHNLWPHLEQWLTTPNTLSFESLADKMGKVGILERQSILPPHLVHLNDKKQNKTLVWFFFFFFMN